MGRFRKKILQWGAGLVLLAMPVMAFASHSLNDVQNALQGKILPWQSVMQTAATDLFYALAAVEFSILFLNHVLQKRGQEDLFSGIIKKVVTLGFFLTVLNNSGTWIPDIINGLAGGAHALGVTAVTPSSIATEALQVFLGVAFAPMAAAKHNTASFFGDLFSGNVSGAIGAFGQLVAASNPISLVMELLISAIVGVLAGLGVLVMALEFLMVQLESYLVIALGVIMLAGGGLRYTSKYVGSYFDYAINVGVRLFILTALAWLVTYSIVPIMTTVMENVPNPMQMGFEMVILGAVIALLSKKASSIASSLLSGKSSFSGDELAKTGGEIAGGTVAAGAGGVALAAGAAGGLAAGGLSAAAGAGGGAAGAGGSLAGAAGAGSEAGAAAGVAAPEVGAMSAPAGGSPAGSAGGGAGSGGMGADRTVQAPASSSPTADSPAGQESQANRAVQAPSASSGSSSSPATSDRAVEAPGGAQTPGGGAGSPTSGQTTEAGSNTSEPNPDAAPAPVNAVPAPAGVPAGGSPASRGATTDDIMKQLQQMQPKQKSAMQSAVDESRVLLDRHTEKATDVGSTGISTSHMKDFD